MAKYEHNIELVIQKDQWHEGCKEFWVGIINRVNKLIADSLGGSAEQGEELVKFRISNARQEDKVDWDTPITERIGLLIGTANKFSRMNGAAYHKGDKILILEDNLREYVKKNYFDLKYEDCLEDSFVQIVAHELLHEFGVFPEVYDQEAVSESKNYYFESKDRGDCMEMCAPEQPFLTINKFHADLIRRNAALKRNDIRYWMKQLSKNNYVTRITGKDAKTQKDIFEHVVKFYPEKPIVIPIKLLKYKTNYAFISANDAIQSFINDAPEYKIEVELEKEEKGKEKKKKKVIFEKMSEEEIKEAIEDDLPLGLPKGSIRAIIALIFSAGAVVGQIITGDVPEWMVAILSAIIGFYFAGRAAAKK